MPDNFQQEFEQLKRDVVELKRAAQQQHVEIDTDLFGVIETISVVPSNSAVPKMFFDQVKIYSSGATYRLYIYDVVGKAWRYTTLT